MKKLLVIALMAAVVLAGCKEDNPEADILHKIPDAAFREYVAAQTDWDTDGNGKLSSYEAAKVTNIDVSGDYSVVRGNIASLNGIEYFTGLTELYCSWNQLTSLDLSNNTVLNYLYCFGNHLTSLDVSNNTALTMLSCNGNNLTSLDVSNSTVLTMLDCSNNDLKSLEVSNNTMLSYLDCIGNHLTSLDISNNRALQSFYCSNNPGDGTIFTVTAWFDDGHIPYYFTTGSWWYGNETITVDYR